MSLRTGRPVLDLRVLLFILIAIPLAACTVAVPVPVATATALPSLTASVIPTDTVPAPTASSTPTLEAASTLVPPSLSVPPDGLRMAYIRKGNLYFQEGNHPPLQLTNSGEDRDPVFFG
jgi:hypothetical protein